MVDELCATPLGPEEVDVVLVGCVVFGGGGEGAGFGGVPPGPILHYSSYQGRIIALPNLISKIKRLKSHHILIILLFFFHFIIPTINLVAVLNLSLSSQLRGTFYSRSVFERVLFF